MEYKEFKLILGVRFGFAYYLLFYFKSRSDVTSKKKKKVLRPKLIAIQYYIPSAEICLGPLVFLSTLLKIRHHCPELLYVNQSFCGSLRNGGVMRLEKRRDNV